MSQSICLYISPPPPPPCLFWIVLAENVYSLFALFLICGAFLGYSPKTFDVNTAQLTEKYKELQWKLHPDKFSDVSEVGPT